MTDTTGSGEDAATPSYEQARDELIEVVRALEAGTLGLEESLALWERGELLAQICERYLAGASAQLDAMIQGGPAGANGATGDGATARGPAPDEG